jgi:hypothetical protein
VAQRSSCFWRLIGGLILGCAASGCSTYQAYHVRFNAPDYTVTPEYFTRTPRRVAILPFATRSLKEKDLEKAQVCRIAFYQHFSVRDFEDVEMQALDRRLLPPETPRPRGIVRQFANTIRKLDVVGITSFLDLKSLLAKDTPDTQLFREWTKAAHEDMQANAYVLGIVRGYGHLYAFVASSIGIATHVEMRATEDDALLWCADYKARNISLPLTIDPLDVPFLLYDIWKNSRGEALDGLAFKVYGDMILTLPSARVSGPVQIRADRKPTRVFSHPTVWASWPRPQVKKGTLMKFLLERRGWYQCEGPDGKPIWMLCRDGTLVDEAGAPLERTDPMSSLWKQPP